MFNRVKGHLMRLNKYLIGFPSPRLPGPQDMGEREEVEGLAPGRPGGARAGQLAGHVPSPVLAWRGGGGSAPARIASMSSAEEARRTLAQLSRERVRAKLQLEPEASGLRLCALGDVCGGPGTLVGGEPGATSARRSSAGPATWLSRADTSSRASDSLLGATGVRSTSTTTAPGVPVPLVPPCRTDDDSRAVKASSAGSFSRKVLARPAGRGSTVAWGLQLPQRAQELQSWPRGARTGAAPSPGTEFNSQRPGSLTKA